MGTTYVWLTIEIYIFWINVLILGTYVAYEKYFTSNKVLLKQHKIWMAKINELTKKYFSYNNDNLDESKECGKNNHINETHVWVADKDDIN